MPTQDPNQAIVSFLVMSSTGKASTNTVKPVPNVE